MKRRFEGIDNGPAKTASVSIPARSAEKLCEDDDELFKEGNRLLGENSYLFLI
jgi:hypothetical protein